MARRTIGRRLGAVALGVVVALALGEIAVRVLGIEPERHAAPRWEVWDGAAYQPTTLWGEGRIRRPSSLARLGVRMGEYVPGARFRIVFDSDPRGVFDEAGGVPMEVNSIGLRGPEVERRKPPGTRRILLLGDSFTFGVGVRDEDTFARRLENALGDDAPAGTRVEVLNAGTQGYNTRDEVAYLEHRWLALEPDLVLIVFYLNDVFSDGTFLNMGQGQGVTLGRPGGFAGASRLYDWVQHGLRAQAARREMDAFYAEPFFREATPQSADESADWDASRRALARAAALSRERGFALGLVVFPELHALDGDYPFTAVHELVLRECAALDIPALDLLPAFRGRDAGSLWVHPSDHHPNEEAHGIAAIAIEAFVRERWGLPGR